MDNLHFEKHRSSRYNEELEELVTRTMEMGGLVEQQLDIAIKSIENEDKNAAKAVEKLDDQINELEREIDEECMLIIAQRQPTASDLRLILAIIKAIKDIERMGDEATRVARAVKILLKENRSANVMGISNLARTVKRQLVAALDSFARADTEAAIAVLRNDDIVDKEYEALLRMLITYMMEDARSIPKTIDILWAARALERIGDRSCNVAESVVFLVEGKDINHREFDEIHEFSETKE